MESTVKERLIEFIKKENLSFRQFEFKVGLANGYVSALKSSIGSDKLQMILDKYPNLNIEWLLCGRGEMYKSHTTFHNTNIGDNINSHILELSDIGNAYLKIMESQSAQVNKSQEQIDRLLAMLEAYQK